MDAFYSALWIFFTASFLGWLGETAMAAVKEHRYVDRSLLYGPLCMIYGFSALVIAVALRDLADGWFSLFLGSAIYATVAEWLAGHMLEKLTGTRWWDYSDRRWNLDGYICLEASAVWGLLGLVTVKWGLGLLIEVQNLLPDTAEKILLWAALVIFLVDALATALTVAGVVHKLPAVEGAGYRIEKLTVRLGTWVLRRTENRIKRAYPEARFHREKKEKPTVFAAGCGWEKLFWLFVIGAFLGDVVETIFVRTVGGVWQSRSSVVWGPFSLVWGLALALGSLLLYRYRDRSDAFLFGAGTLLGGAYEYLCSVFTELMFGMVFWDYSHIPFNLGGRINLLYCFFWGIAAVVWIKICYPRLSALIERMPIRWGKVLTAVLTVFMACNIAVSALALGRWDSRSRGEAASNAVEVWLDDRFGDERMERIYPAMVRTE